MRKLRAALRKRQWSPTRAAAETGVGEQCICNLARIRETRTTTPSKVQVITVVALLEKFPELDLADFVPGTALSVR